MLKTQKQAILAGNNLGTKRTPWIHTLADVSRDRRVQRVLADACTCGGMHWWETIPLPTKSPLSIIVGSASGSCRRTGDTCIN